MIRREQSISIQLQCTDSEINDTKHLISEFVPSKRIMRRWRISDAETNQNTRNEISTRDE